MLKALNAFALVGLLAASAGAQIPQRSDDGGTDFTSRGCVTGTTANGWAYTAYATGHGGAGHELLTGWQFVYQDQNCASLEIWESTMNNSTVGTVPLPIPFGPGGPGTTSPADAWASTGTFLSPAGPASPCAWIYTVGFGTALTVDVSAPANFNTLPGNHMWVGTYMPLNAGWVADGTSCHISIATTAGASAEWPNAAAFGSYPPAVPGAGAGSEFGGYFNLSTAAFCYAGTWRITNVNNPRVGDATRDHISRSGARDTTGVFATHVSIGPDNFGFAGRYADAVNTVGNVPPRADNGVYKGSSNTLIVGLATMWTSTTTLRDLGVPASVIPGIGVFELNPGDPLFPGVLGTVPTAGLDNLYVLDLDLLGIRGIMTGGFEYHMQEVRADLAGPTLSLSGTSKQSWG